MKTDTFSEQNFWTAFQRDLSRAQARVIIQSPFIASRRVQQLQIYISKMLESNIRLCIFVQAPNGYHGFPDWYRRLKMEEKAQANDTLSTIQWLSDQGVHVNLRESIHEKIAVIDNAILWEGSLNILSHKNTTERMRRIQSPLEVERALVGHRLNGCEHCIKLLADAESELLVGAFTKAREQKNMSQKSLAKICRAAQSTICRAELGDNNVNIGVVKKMAENLGYKLVAVPDWLVFTLLSMQNKVNSQNETTDEQSC